METKVDEMLKAGVIHPAHPGEVKCVAPSVLAHKLHENTGLSMEELKHKVNDECVKHSLPAAFDLPLAHPHPKMHLQLHHPRNGTYARTLER